MGLWQQSHLTVKVLSHRERLMLCRLAIVTLRAPDARFAQSNDVIIRFQTCAPTLRCHYVATTRLSA